MLLDVDLGALVERHRARGAAVTLLLRDDPRAESFGSIGIDAQGCVRRIGSRFDLGGATRAGVYTWVNVVSARALDSLPEREVFGHLDHWIAPRLAAGARDVHAELAAARRLPLGAGRDAERVPRGESAAAAPLLPRRGSVARRAGARFEPELVLGAGATLGAGASLQRAVVWDGEIVPPGCRPGMACSRAGASTPARHRPIRAATPVPSRERPDERGGLRRHQRRLRGGRAAPVGAARARAARRPAARLRQHHDQRARGARASSATRSTRS